MSQLYITKEFRFEGAHALTGYDGKCKHIHGHSYKLLVTIAGEPSVVPGHPKEGMIMDFNDLETFVRQHVIDVLDHTLMLHKDAPLQEVLKKAYNNIKTFDFQPTCENLTLYIAGILEPAITPPHALHSVRLYETPRSFAEWVR